MRPRNSAMKCNVFLIDNGARSDPKRLFARLEQTGSATIDENFGMKFGAIIHRLLSALE